MYLGSLCVLTICATLCKSLEVQTSKTKHSEVVRMEKKKSITQSIKRSSYKTSEKIEKAPSEDHPCNLTRTTMRISFPALRSELFVNILGYREPNLVTLWQCKGFCGGGGSQVGCTAVRMKQKKVNMMFRTNSSGRDSKERTHELILDEHVECGCECPAVAKYRCGGKFNPETCSCSCEDSMEDINICEGEPSTYWDRQECVCRSRGVVARDNREAGTPCEDRGGQVGDNIEAVGYVAMGSLITISIFLLAATHHYRRKLRSLKNSNSKEEEASSCTNKQGQKCGLIITTQKDRKRAKEKKHQLESSSHILSPKYQYQLDWEVFEQPGEKQDNDLLGLGGVC